MKIKFPPKSDKECLLQFFNTVSHFVLEFRFV